jgi:hypothetical protein
LKSLTDLLLLILWLSSIKSPNHAVLVLIYGHLILINHEIESNAFGIDQSTSSNNSTLWIRPVVAANRWSWCFPYIEYSLAPMKAGQSELYSFSEVPLAIIH